MDGLGGASGPSSAHLRQEGVVPLLGTDAEVVAQHPGAGMDAGAQLYVKRPP